MTASPTLDAPTRAGNVLMGKYEVERVVGEGAMGVVVTARHLVLGERVAVKLLKASMQSPEIVSRFVREAQATARIRSDHVVRVYDVGTLESGTPFIVMEHLQGGDLRTVLRQRGPLPIGEAVDYFRQACEAIAEAHRSGIVHRDLKPANLFLQRRPTGEVTVKVLDFGISKLLGNAGALANLTSTEQPLGTPLYMPPEQLRSAKAANERSDIWALGVILHELLTGTTPFQASSVADVFSKILNDAPPPLRSMRPEVPAAIEGAVLRALAKRPEDRHADVDSFVRSLAAPPPVDSAPPTRGLHAIVQSTVLLGPSPIAASGPAMAQRPASQVAQVPAPNAPPTMHAVAATVDMTALGVPAMLTPGPGASAATLPSRGAVPGPRDGIASKRRRDAALALGILALVAVAALAMVLVFALRRNPAAAPLPPSPSPGPSVEASSPATATAGAASAESSAPPTASAAPAGDEADDAAEAATAKPSGTPRVERPATAPPRRPDNARRPAGGVPDFGGRQ